LTRSFLATASLARVGLFLTACLAGASLSSPALAEYPAFAPPGEHFTIPFPAGAQESDTAPNGNPLHQWSRSDGDFFYAVGHIVSSGKPFTGAQLSGDLADFIKGTNATLLSQQNIGWPSPDGRAEAVQFHFRLPNGLLGQGLFVWDGVNGYSAAILDRHTGSESPYMMQYINSLTILP